MAKEEQKTLPGVPPAPKMRVNVIDVARDAIGEFRKGTLPLDGLVAALSCLTDSQLYLVAFATRVSVGQLKKIIALGEGAGTVST